ncbi:MULTISPECIES: FixH family protein [Flavobacterium]|uniref:FixH family protein n=1 Tax=Flavobacterium jumunjinense TaxID=998845 RepID=A0ABV5GM67_9FLAO|nr:MULTISPECIES: FixH family protein [Flavobacterium]
MKINWGTGIVIAFALFISFILYFVLKVQLNDDYERELVVSDYYQQELKVQGNIENTNNANELETKIIIEKAAEGIEVSFPESFDYKLIKGKVSLYRPSNQKLDSEMQISLSSSHLLIPKSNLVGGLWDITIDWEYQGVSYRNKKSIYY